MYCKNIKGKDKIVNRENRKKKTYLPICIFTVVWLLIIYTYTQIEHAENQNVYLMLVFVNQCSYVL